MESTADQVTYLRLEMLIQIALQTAGWLVFLVLIARFYVRALLTKDRNRQALVCMTVSGLVILLFAFSARQDYAIHRPAAYIAAVRAATVGDAAEESFPAWDVWRRKSNFTLLFDILIALPILTVFVDCQRRIFPLYKANALVNVIALILIIIMIFRISALVHG